LRHIDPTGHQAEELPPGIDEDEHERLLALLAEAQRLSDLVQQGGLTDVEALALLMDYAIELNSNQFLAWENVDWTSVRSDLGLVLGGIRIVVGRGADGQFRYELTHPDDNPFGQYYTGYGAFHASGFAPEFYDDIAENQVRHFIGGLVGGSAWFGLGREQLLDRETPGSGDYNLHLQAFELADDLTTAHREEAVGNWIIGNLANEEVQNQHSIVREPEGPCLGSFIPAYVIGVLVFVSIPCCMIRRRKKHGSRV
jgi:hypothetical protein